MSCVSLILFSGCEKASPVSRVSGQPTGAKDVIESQIAASESSISSETTSSLSSEETTVTESLFETSSNEEFDVDLTIDNADLIYAEVFAMVYTPEDYVGKTVKMKGQFVFYYDEEKDQYYYACLIKDAMACCAGPRIHSRRRLWLPRRFSAGINRDQRDRHIQHSRR